MRKLLQIGKLILLFIELPFQISNGHKKRAYRKIKELMVSANLL
jgi:hypothetical protein